MTVMLLLSQEPVPAENIFTNIVFMAKPNNYVSLEKVKKSF